MDNLLTLKSYKQTVNEAIDYLTDRLAEGKIDLTSCNIEIVSLKETINKINKMKSFKRDMTDEVCLEVFDAEGICNGCY